MAKDIIEVNGVKYQAVKKSRKRYSKRIVLLCLIVMSALLAVDAVLCWRAGQQLDSASVAAMAGFWGAEVFASAWIKSPEAKNEAAQQAREQYRSGPGVEGDNYGTE